MKMSETELGRQKIVKDQNRSSLLILIINTKPTKSLYHRGKVQVSIAMCVSVVNSRVPSSIHTNKKNIVPEK
jgi:hypothetical protein